MSLPTKEELEYLGSRTMTGLELMLSFVPEQGKASDLLAYIKRLENRLEEVHDDDAIYFDVCDKPKWLK